MLMKLIDAKCQWASDRKYHKKVMFSVKAYESILDTNTLCTAVSYLISEHSDFIHVRLWMH